MAHSRAHGTRRVWLPAAFFGLFAAGIFARLVQLQIVDHEQYAAAAAQELLGDDTVFARRGSILDRNGNVLATSVDTWDVYVNTRAWKDPVRAKNGSEVLAKQLSTDAAGMRAAVSASKAVDVLLRRDVEFETGKRIIAASLPGVVLLPNTARVNPEGDLAASVLGFIGLDNTGLAGVEAAYNEVLQGTAGRAIFERDTAGDPIPFGRYIAKSPVAGKDLVLTIDRYLQQMAEHRLEAALKEHSAKGGAIIVMDPATGEILAMATTPGLKYSTLDLTDGTQLELLRNRAVTDVYEPGSVMKVVTAAAAIDQGRVTPDTSYVDNGVVYVSGVPLYNWDFHVYGPQTMTGVLQNSINTGAVFMMQKLGTTLFQRYLDAFGFGKPTGIDLTGEATGIVRRPTDPDWSPVDVATQAFGQSVSVTPIQMISAVATAINGGKVVKPHIVKATVDANGSRVDVPTTVLRQAIKPETSATIRKMLYDVVNPGWFHPGKPKDYGAGGKSGTANVPVRAGYDARQIASFVGFAPADDPKILVLVKLDENQDLLTGTMAAGPIFASLADDILRYLNVPPDTRKLAATR